MFDSMNVNSLITSQQSTPSTFTIIAKSSWLQSNIQYDNIKVFRIIKRSLLWLSTASEKKIIKIKVKQMKYLFYTNYIKTIHPYSLSHNNTDT